MRRLQERAQLQACLDEAVNALLIRAGAATLCDPAARLRWLGAYLLGEQPVLGGLQATVAERRLALPALEAALEVACNEALRESAGGATTPLAWRIGQRLQHASNAGRREGGCMYGLTEWIQC